MCKVQTFVLPLHSRCIFILDIKYCKQNPWWRNVEMYAKCVLFLMYFLIHILKSNCYIEVFKNIYEVVLLRSHLNDSFNLDLIVNIEINHSFVIIILPFVFNHFGKQHNGNWVSLTYQGSPSWGIKSKPMWLCESFVGPRC